MSMKFFRQTKETKRKLSFFMALAMVISLLPVSPVAKAANTKEATVTVNCTVDGAELTSVKQSTIGSAIVTLTASDGYTFDNNSVITVSTNGAINSKAANSCTVAAVTDSAMASNSKVEYTVSKNNTTYTITLTNISDNITVTITGNASKTSDEEKPPVEDEDNCTVTLAGTLGANMTLNVTNGTETVKNGGKVAKNSILNVEVLPAADYICANVPTLTVSGASVTSAMKEADNKFVATVKVTDDATITVSGGKVTKVTTDVEVPKDNANGATVDDSIKAPEVLDSIMKAFEGKAVSGGTLTLEKVKELLAVSGSSIKTSFDVKDIENEYTDNTAANKLATGATLPEGVEMTTDSIAKMIKAGTALDITLNSTLTSGDVTITTTVTKLGKVIKITMNIPENIKKAGRTYYAIRVHDGKATVISCKEADGKITFESDKFSTYIISFVEDDSTDKPTPPSGGGGIGGYVPSTSATPAPSATAAPSASPSADPSATTGVDSSAAPAESGAPAPGGDTTPTKAPTATDKPVDDNKDDNNTGGSTTVKVGKKATVSGSQYKVTAVKGTRTVQFTKGKKNAKSIVVPSTVKISGKNYKVTTIAKNAFKGNKKLAKVTIGKNVNKIGVSAFQNCSKLKSIVIKSTKLTAKKVGKNAFKGINKKATFKVPKSKVKAYKKIVKAKGAGKNVKVKK